MDSEDMEKEGFNCARRNTVATVIGTAASSSGSGSLRRAAEQLGTEPSTVSRAITVLEADVAVVQDAL